MTPSPDETREREQQNDEGWTKNPLRSAPLVHEREPKPTPSGPLRPVIYLDVDDTVLRFPPDRDRQWWAENRGGAPADGVAEFFVWAREHCEVRWLTMWAMRGYMHPELEAKLARLLKLPLALVEGCHNELEHGGFKTNGINWDEHRAGREWFWIEDGISDDEAQVLRGNHAFDRFVKCDASRHPAALHDAMRTIQARLACSDVPSSVVLAREPVSGTRTDSWSTPKTTEVVS